MPELHVAAFSGGKDSTAMVLAMRQHGYPIDRLLITPTGDELPELADHWRRVADLIGIELTVPRGPTLADVIESERALPNHRMRFCTRMIKISPAIARVKRQALAGFSVTMHIGLRADEPARKGIIDRAIRTRFPLQELGMDLVAVRNYLDFRGITVPARTDCARCYHQRIGEWWDLWKLHPEIWADAERQELEIGATFRSPGRDTWPVELVQLRKRFEQGHVPLNASRQVGLSFFEAANTDTCRVCSL